MVYLTKLMTKCILVEREKKEREKYIRLRTKGKMKPIVDSDVDKSDEFTYEYFSRFFGSIDRGGPMEDMAKPSAEQDPKGAKSPAPAESQPANKTPAPPPTKKGKGLRVKKKLRKKKKKKKKKSRRPKLRKRRVTILPKPKKGTDQRVKKFKPISSLNKGKKGKPVVIPGKKVANKGLKSGVKKKPDSSKTLIQMLKASEQQEKKKKDSSGKS